MRASSLDAVIWGMQAVHFRQPGLGFGQDHLYAYDVETLAARLTSAGFVDIAQRAYDPARDSRPHTLYVDARKPGRPGGGR